MHIEQLSEGHHDGVTVLRPVGPLFWAAAHTLEEQLLAVESAKAVLVRMSRVSSLDASGAQILRDTIGALHRRAVARRKPLLAV